MSQSVYISGPMIGQPELNFPAFHSAAAQLAARGFSVVNPCEILTTPGRPWEDYLRANIKALCYCDAVALLPGWQNSRGAQLEQTVAHRLGMDIRPLADFLAEPVPPVSDVVPGCASCAWWHDKTFDNIGRSVCLLLSGEDDSEEHHLPFRNTGRFFSGPHFTCQQHTPRPSH